MDIPVVVYVVALAGNSVNVPVATGVEDVIVLDFWVNVMVIGICVMPLGKVTFT